MKEQNIGNVKTWLVLAHHGLAKSRLEGITTKRPQKLNKRQSSFLSNILGPAFDLTLEEDPFEEDVAIVDSE